MEEVFNWVGELDSTIRIPTLKFPAALLGLLPALDWMGNKLMGLPRFATRQFIAEYGGRDLHCSSERIRQELGWRPRQMRLTLADTLAWTRKIFFELRWFALIRPG